MEMTDRTINLGPGTIIAADAACQATAAFLASGLAARLEQAPTIQAELRGKFGIALRIDPALAEGAEGYRLEVRDGVVELVGRDAPGLFYATRTLLQLLPPPAVGAAAKSVALPLPVCSIADRPRFHWRGMMLDSARHFIPVENVLQFLDWMAWHKLNTLHWHLTDDQGWRVEIKRYPKLTTIGAWRASSPPYGDRKGSDGQRYGGFYTQEQLRTIVAYAAARHIQIIPEIDMPGHMDGVLASYPEFGNTDFPGYAPTVRTMWGISENCLAPKEETFRFIDDVLTEICAIFPSRYVHIGGDEVKKKQWENSAFVQKLMREKGLKDSKEVQSYFIRRLEVILHGKGRRLIGWDEIREGGLSPDATVMVWRDEKDALASASEGHDVINAVKAYVYFDYYQAPSTQELAKGPEYEAIGGFLPLPKVYSFDPVPAALAPDKRSHILGTQAQLWAEYFKTWSKVEYHAFPRIAALAEIAWTPQELRRYDDFKARLLGVLRHYDAAGLRRGDIYEGPPPPPPAPKAKAKPAAKATKAKPAN